MFQLCNAVETVADYLKISHTKTLMVITGTAKVLHADNVVSLEEPTENIAFKVQTPTMLGIGMAHPTQPN